VVLPAPFGPIKPAIAPLSTFRDTPSTAVMPPKRLETERTSSKMNRLAGRLGLNACILPTHQLRYRRAVFATWQGYLRAARILMTIGSARGTRKPRT
jgi:hypothetical protein